MVVRETKTICYKNSDKWISNDVCPCSSNFYFCIFWIRLKCLIALDLEKYIYKFFLVKNLGFHSSDFRVTILCDSFYSLCSFWKLNELGFRKEPESLALTHINRWCFLSMWPVKKRNTYEFILSTALVMLTDVWKSWAQLISFVLGQDF